jgi:hypothetical protein
VDARSSGVRPLIGSIAVSPKNGRSMVLFLSFAALAMTQKGRSKHLARPDTP